MACCLKVFVYVTIACVYVDSNEMQNAPETQCYCVPQHLCMDNDAAVNGQGLFDIRYESNPNPCANYFDVCCENPIQTSELPPEPQGLGYQGCGYQAGISTRITGDMVTTEFGEFPWTLAVLYREPETERKRYKCGASLIHPQVALTAAHCLTYMDMHELTIRAGEWNTKSRDEPIPPQDILVQEVLLHPSFHAASLKNDIALLFLVEPVVLTDSVGVICLPNLKMDVDGKCIAAGWGKNAFKKGRHSPVLKKVELPLVPRAQCVRALRNTRLGAHYNLHRSFICAGGEDSKDTCEGDGGSPLVCKIQGHGARYAQVGIVAWGIGCGENDIPGVYVNVALYTDWIDKQMMAKDLDASYYKY